MDKNQTDLIRVSERSNRDNEIKTFVQPQPVEMPDISPEQSKKIKESIHKYMHMQELLKHIDDIKRFCETQIHDNQILNGDNNGCMNCPFLIKAKFLEQDVNDCMLFEMPKDWNINKSEILNKYKPSGYMHKYNKGGE